MEEFSSPRLQFGILGPLQVSRDGRPIELGPLKQQQVLALLLCNANSMVPVDSLIDSLWEDRPPRTARKNLQVYISGLRALLGATPGAPRITHRANGYVLSVAGDELDWLAFERNVRDIRRLRNREQPAAVARALRAALALWRGPALDGMRGTAALEAAARRLADRFLIVFEDWAEAELEIGAAPDMADKIAIVAQRHPFRERLRMVQMATLSRLGRRTEALAIFDEVRRSLASEFGLAPSGALAQLHQSLLRERAPVGPRGASAAARTLPRDVAAFTGRAEQTRALEDTLTGAGERLAVIAGPAGVGKTTLAVHAAHLLRDRFPDGCCFVRLRRDGTTPRPPEPIAAQLLWAVDVPGPHPDGTAAVAAWQRWLTAHRALVVLDDVRREAEVRPLLPESGESAVIITARTRLAGLAGPAGRGYAHRLTLPPFSGNEAVDLLRRIIGARRVDGDRECAERIVEAVGRLPLAVRVVGDKLAGPDHVPLKEYLVRLEGAANPLDELTVGDVAVRARLAEAVADLEPAADRAFRRLGALPLGAFTLRAAATALGSDEAAAIRTLESLLDTGLVGAPDAETAAHDVVYEMPVLIHAYARELADADARLPA